jgi:ClpP class serine protease
MLQELRTLQEQHDANPPPPGGPSPYDVLRRRYLAKLSQKTGRATIVYATSWLENREVPNAAALSINPGDVQGFMEAVSNIKERQLDLIVTSPGGSPEAA